MLTLQNLLDSRKSLNDIERLARDGAIVEPVIGQWLEEWNGTPGRFTRAVWNGRYMEQYCNECKARCTVNGCKCEG
jgi:hypothetical protein